MTGALLEAPAVPLTGLLWLLLPVAAVWWVLRSSAVGNHGRFLVAAVRGTVQLSVVGYLLIPLFQIESPAAVLGIVCMICCLAAFFSLGVLGKGPGLGIWPLAVGAILPVVTGLTVFALLLVAEGVPALDARYTITLAGMLAGNAMNATAIAGERFLASLSESRDEIEDRLLRGLTGAQSVRPQRAAAIRAAVTPSINSLLAVGLVSFPGMMTGQIMAGQDPLTASAWQLSIMALWTAAATLSASGFLFLLTRRVMAGHRIRVELNPVAGPDFRVADYSPGPGSAPTAFDERPPEAMTRGFIARPPDE